ncbi:MAG: helix-turn-helix transcriptional regulator [Chloroflexi bacterium]|nr:helix-turn-helix transcriptional regulator [Chloroflexota bacterium]
MQVALGLTPAESRLAVMVASGQHARDIAARTGRSEGTVRWHIQNIFRKQGISGQADLVRRVLSLEGFPDFSP